MEFSELDDFDSLSERVPREIDESFILLTSKFRQMTELTEHLSILYEEAVHSSIKSSTQVLDSTRIFVERCEGIEFELDNIDLFAKRTAAIRSYLEELEKRVNKLKT